jgi:hypothetical protein
MCAEAEKYGIQVIVDVVANHMANHMANNTLSLKIPAYIRLDSNAWHDYTKDTTGEQYANGDRYGITQYCMGGVPDLNTGSDKVQGYVLKFLKECIAAGADGFRFDGAKHIETPDDDPSFASDFWPTVLGGAQAYAESLGRNVYFYGEVLDSPGQLPLAAYTKHMSVTDNSWGRGLLHEIAGGSASQNSNGYNKSADKTQIVTWAECHDDFCTSEGHNTSGISAANINKAWALIAARADVMSLYFARPTNIYSTTMGTASLNTGWDYAEVKAVNKFHNAFVGQSETVGNSGKIAYVVRGTTGIVLVNASGTSASVSISGTGMANGTYTDQITGNTFKVSGGKITGSIGSTGIAVVYNAAPEEHEHHYTAVVTAPGCATGGYTTYTCSCGDSYIGNETPATGHNYVNGTCTKCGGKDSDEGEIDFLDVPVVTAKSFSLSFESEILVNLYYTVSDITNVAEMGMLVFYNRPSAASYALADEVYTEYSYNSTTGRYMSTTSGIAAKRMGDTRYYAAFVKLTNGTYAYSTVYDYSPKKYAYNMLEKSTTSASQKALCVAMLNYGAAAQTYFDYNADDLMNADLTAAQKKLVTRYNASLFSGPVAATTTKSRNFTKTSTGFSARRASVSFEGAFAINFYFVPNATVKGNITFYYWTPEAYEAAYVLTTANASGTCSMVAAGDGSYWAEVPAVAAKRLDKTYYVVGIYTSSTGAKCCTGVIAYSLSKYCMNNATGDMGELAQATAMYGYYAKCHFNN